MKLRTKISTAVVAVAASASLAAPALAAVTFDPATGTGFVGKGDVQLAFGWNNADLQRLAGTVKFSASAPASQAYSSSATQTATQSATTSLMQVVSCDFETGNGKKRVTDYRYGDREGARSATRTGSRTGARAGTQSGALASNVAYETRTNAKGITGFNLRGFSSEPAFTATEDVVWGDPTFDNGYDFGAYTYGEIVWGGWDNTDYDAGASCLNGGDKVSNLSEVTTESDPVEGDVVEGAVSYGAPVAGAVMRTGDYTVTFTR